MSGVAVQLRKRRRDAARPTHHITKAVMADDFRGHALDMLAYASDPRAAASALKALDHAERLDKHPRCGWYPRRPGPGWKR